MDNDALKRLIAQVEAGTLTGDSPTTYADGMGALIERSGVCRRGDWDDVALAHDGSLDAALSFLDALLPNHDWGRALEGQMWVREQDGPFVWSGRGYPPARGLLLAILRAKLAAPKAPPLPSCEIDVSQIVITSTAETHR